MVVTASTDGIGFAIARRLAQEGAKVMLSSRRSTNVDRALKQLHEELKNNMGLHGMVCHVGKPEDRMSLLEQTVKKFGKIDVLVSNAAVNPAFGLTMDVSCFFNCSL